jgi:RHS repeat-associated protein
LGEFDYTYDAASNPLTANQAGSMGDLEANRTYSYDTLNRLTRADYTDSQDWLGFTPLKSTYDYDDLGNRISHQYRDAAAIAYEHDKANRMTLIDGLPQGYDLAGNVTLAYSANLGTSYIYKYDHHNRLTGVYDDTGTTRKAAFTYDALGRRIEYINDVQDTTTDYYYDGVNEIVETDGSGNDLRYYVHGLSYVDERLMMANIDEYLNESQEYENRPYYFTLDRMYNVRFLVDRAGALVERYAYDAYGRHRIRESCGRGDMDNDTQLTSVDDFRFTAAKNGTIWDPRADMDDDGDVDANDQTAFNDKVAIWPPPTGSPVVRQAFSDVGNRFGFQGRVHFDFDNEASAVNSNLLLVDHRGRMNDPVTGRWPTEDPAGFVDGKNLYEFVGSNPISSADPTGNFKSMGHRRVTMGGYLKSGVRLQGDLIEAVIAENILTDDHSLFVAAAHAQDQRFVPYLQRLLKAIRDVDCDTELLSNFVDEAVIRRRFSRGFLR